MATRRVVSALVLVTILGGCAGTFTVTLGQSDPRPQKTMTTASIVPQDFNSPEMDSNIRTHLSHKGIAVKPPLPAGTRQSTEVDAIIVYTDAWRWDLGMYLKYLGISILDGASGQSLVSGTWQDGRLRSFQDPQVVVSKLLDEMLSQLPVPH